MSHRYPRLRYFQHNPSGPHSVAAIVDHATITSTQVIRATVTVSGNAGQLFQFVATPVDAAGNTIVGVVPTWTVSDGGIASVDATGLVTMLRSGSTTITATVDGRAYPTVVSVSVASGQAQDGSLADVRAVIGDANILRWADFTLGGTVTKAGSNITSVTDPRGAVYGDAMIGHGSAGPTIGADGGAVVVQDSDQYMQWPTSVLLNLQRQADFWVAMVIAVTSVNGNPFVSIDDGATDFGTTAQSFALRCRNDTTPNQLDFGGFHGPNTDAPSPTTMWPANRTPVASDTTYRLVILEKHRGPATQQGVFNEMIGYEVYGSARVIRLDAGITEPDYRDESGVLNWGRESGLGTVGSKCKAILYGTGVLPAVARQALWRYAQRLGAVMHATSNAVAAVPTKLTTLSHDSNDAGYGTSNPDTKAWPVLMQANLNTSNPGVYLVKQDGWAGTTAVDMDNWYSRLAEPQINTLAIAKHVHIVGTQGTNDIGINDGPTILAAIKDQCQKAKAGGAKVLVFTIPRSSTNDEGTNAAMAFANPLIRTAVPDGWADAMFDIYTVIGFANAGVHFDDAQNAAIEANVRPLMIALAA